MQLQTRIVKIFRTHGWRIILYEVKGTHIKLIVVTKGYEEATFDNIEVFDNEQEAIERMTGIKEQIGEAKLIKKWLE